MDYEPTITNAWKQCGASLEEDEQFLDDGSFRWRTVFKNTCPHRNVLITVAMNTTEWYDIETFETYKNDGTVKQDTVLIGCEIDEDDESLTACTFLVGKLKNKEDFGLNRKKQPAGGWLSGEGAFGMVWWSSEWIRKNNLQYPEGSEFDF